MNTEIVLDPKEKDFVRAAEVLKQGGLVAFPTETVYGLGGNALSADSAKKIYAAKGRPSDNPLIIHLAFPEMAEEYAVTSPLYYKLAVAFMPGPLTVILPKKSIIPSQVTGGLETVAVRVPSDETAHRLLLQCDFPVAAPSANISGKPSPTAVSHVIDDMNGKIDMILGGKSCSIGLESTIVSVADDVITLLRPGAITPEMLSAFCDVLRIDPCLEHPMEENRKPLAPGMKYKHYAPEAQLILLDGKEEDVSEFLLQYKDDDSVGFLFTERILKKVGGKHPVLLGEDHFEQASRLFAALRAFDKIHEVKTVYAPLPQKDGMGFAVYNRMAKAAGFLIKKV